MRNDIDENGNYKGDCIDEKDYNPKKWEGAYSIGKKNHEYVRTAPYKDKLGNPVIPKNRLQPNAKKVTDKEVAEALGHSMGIYATAIAWLQKEKGITVTRSCIEGRVRKSPYLQKVLHDVNQQTVDIAESKLYKMLKEDDPKAIMFILKTKGKDRGWTERVEQEVVNPQSLAPKINITFLGNEMPVVDAKIGDQPMVIEQDDKQ